MKERELNADDYFTASAGSTNYSRRRVDVITAPPEMGEAEDEAPLR